MGTTFSSDVVVEPIGGGRYLGDVSDRWNLRPLPQGGVITAFALKAMADVLGDPAQSLRTMHTTFAGQVTHGPLEIEVEVLRRGRSMSQLRAEVRNVGADRGHLTIAAFGSSRRGFDTTELAPPEVPAPDDCPSFRDPPPPGVPTFEPMPFWDEMVEGRPALGRPPWSEEPPGPAVRASWYRFEEPPADADGNLDPTALPILVDIMPGAMWERLDKDTPPWFGPSVDLTLHVLDAAPTDWVLGVNTIRHASDGYASADMALWDLAGDPRLVAYATQVFLFTFL